MANVLGLALKVNADATGLRLDPVERALQRLGTEAEKVGAVFTKFAASSGAAAEEQARTATRFEQLANSLRNQEITAEQYAEAFAKIKAEATATAAVFDRGAQTAAKFADEQSKTADALGKLAEELRLGAIEAPLFAKALEDLAGVDFAGTEEAEAALRSLVEQAKNGTLDLDAAAKSLASLAEKQEEYSASQERAAEILKKLVTDEQVRARQYEEYQSLRQQGLLTEEEHAALLEKLGPVTEEARKAEERLASDRERATRILQSLITPQEAYQSTVEELNRLLSQDLLTQEKYNQALAEAGATLDKATGSTALYAEQQRQAAAIINSQLSDLDKFIEKQAELQTLFEAGVLPLENYTRALGAAATGLEGEDLAAAAEASGLSVEDLSGAASEAATNTDALSKSLSILPGFLGTVADTTVNLFTNLNTLAGSLATLPASLAAFASSLYPPLATALAFVTTPLGAFAATLLVGGGLSTLVSSLASRVERLTNQAEKLGVSFGFIQVLEETATRSSTSVEAVSNAFTRLQKTIAGAGEESEKSIQALSRLGISFDEISTLEPEEQYLAVGRALRAIEDPAKRTAAAIELFGKSGASLLPFFKDLPGAAADFERLGGGINEQDQQRLADFTENANTLIRSLARFGELVTTPFAGIISAVTKVSAEFVNAANAIVEILGTALRPAFDTIGTLIRSFAPLLSALANGLRVVARVLEPLADTIVPALVTGLLALRLAQSTAAIASFATGIYGVVASMVAYTASVGFATAATVALETAIAATGIGALVIGLGLGVNALIKYLTSSDDATAATKRGTAAAADATENAKKYGAAIAGLIRVNKGLGDTLEAVTKSVEEAKLRSVEFGQEGFNAAVRFEESFNRLKEQLGKELFNAETFKIEAEKARIAFDRELRAIEENARLEIQITENARQVLAGIDQSISAAIEKANEFGNAGFDAALKFQNQLLPLKEQFDEGILNEEAVRRLVSEANREYDKQITKLQQVRDEQKKAIEEDKRRVDELLKASDATDQITRDLASLQREITRTQQEFIAGGDMALFARLEDLRVLQDQLETKAVQAAQGFEDGFAKAFERVTASVNDLVSRASEFGEAGVEAGAQLQRAIAAAQKQAERGILNRPAFEREVAAQKKLFEDRLAVAQRVNELILRDEKLITKEREDAQKNLARLEEDVAKRKVRLQDQIAAAQSDGDRLTVATLTRQIKFLEDVVKKERDLANDKQRVEALLFANANARVQQEFIGKQRILNIENQVAQRQREATANLAALRADIAQSEKALEVARQQGDFGVARALTQRLQFLDQVEAKEKLIAEGRNGRELRLFLQRQDHEKRFAQEAAKQQELLAQSQQRTQEAAQQERQKILEAQQQAYAAEFQRQVERIRELNTLGSGVIEGSDIRTSEGAAQFLQLAANRQDPMLIEARLQTRRLTELRAAVVSIVEGFTGLPVVRIPGALG